MKEQERIEELVAAKQAAQSIVDERERYAETSTIAHKIHNFITANDLTFSLSDLKISGRCKEIRKKVQERRTALAVQAGLIGQR